MLDLSISGKKWIYKKFDNSYVNFLKENFLLDEITARLLSIRNIDKNYVESFLKPSIKNLIPNPNILKDMEKTSKRILQAINKREKIGIFGDYDVDGASSTALLGNYLKIVKQDFDIYPIGSPKDMVHQLKVFKNFDPKNKTYNYSRLRNHVI